MSCRVAIVGAGLVTSIGQDVPQTWSALLASKSGISPTGYDSSLLASIGETGESDRLFKMAKLSLDECIADAQWTTKASERTALVFAHGGPDNEHVVQSAKLMDEKGRCRPDTVYRSMNSYITARLSKEFSIMGPAYSVSAACAGSSHAIHLARLLIESGTVDRCLCGGGEIISKYTLSAFAGMRAVLSQRDELGAEAIRPFGADRSGIALGEACGWIALEKADNDQRGAIRISESRVYNVPDATYGDVLDQTEWDRLMSDAVDGSCDLLMAHATSTTKGDLAEGSALLRHFPDAEIRSTKYLLGHTLSASSIVDVIIIRESMLRKIVAPIGHEYEIDPLLAGLKVATTQVVEKPIRKAVKISAAFGGAVGLLVLDNTG